VLVFSVEKMSGQMCSTEALQRLEEEARLLFEHISENPPAVGNSVFVEYDPAFCEKHQIGRFGRKTIKDGQVLFHAGPREVVHPCVYEMDDHNVMDYIHQWQVGGYCPVPVDKLLEGPKWPVPLGKKKKIIASGSYEQELFRNLLDKEITLVNPSFSSMASLKVAGGGYVMLTSDADETWSRDVCDFVRQSKGKLQLLRKFEVRGRAYLGNSIPQWYPEGEWFHLILSPFIPMSTQFKSYDVQMTEEGFVVRYEKKKGYVVSSVLRKSTPFYLYNPETVDCYLHMKAHTKWYYVESSFPMTNVQEDDRKVMHAPWFVSLPQGLEWEEERIYPGKVVQMKSRGHVIYDIQGSGTYLSRRTRFPAPKGWEWVPLLGRGTHWVTVSSLKPQKVHGVEVVERGSDTITIFDDAKLIDSMVRVRCTEDAQVLRLPVEGRFSWPLFSDTPLFLVELQSHEVSQIPSGLVVNEILVTNRGQVFLPHQVEETGVSFSPGGANFLLMGLGRGQMRPALVLRTKVQDYIVCPQELGDKFLFPRAADVEMMCSSLSLFSKDWLSVASQIGGAENNGSLVSTETFVQTVMSSFQKYEIDDETGIGLTAYQVAKRVGCSIQFATRYMLTTPGFCVWRITNGRTEFMLEANISLRASGVLNNVTKDGQKWVDILRGWGTQREKMRFVSRDLKSLVAFLRLNYCFVVRREIDGMVELAVRRPKK